MRKKIIFAVYFQPVN